MPKNTPRAPKRHPKNVAPVVAIGDRLTVKSRLGLLGWSTLTAWAVAHGYERRMVGYCIRTWANRADRRPHGGIARALMSDLLRTLAEGRRPEHAAPEGR